MPSEPSLRVGPIVTGVVTGIFPSQILQNMVQDSNILTGSKAAFFAIHEYTPSQEGLAWILIERTQSQSMFHRIAESAAKTRLHIVI